MLQRARDSHQAGRRARRLLGGGLVALFMSVLAVPAAQATALRSGPTASKPASEPPGWTSAGWVDPLRSGTIEAISCPSATFCVAVDDGGIATTFNGSSWSWPQMIDPSGAADAQLAGPLSDVSCASTTFCVAVGDSAGRAVMFNGSRWTLTAPLDSKSALALVSCPTATFCMAADTDGYVLRYDGASWSAPSQLNGSGGAFAGLSCVSSSFCALMSHSASAFGYTYDGTSWKSYSLPTGVYGVNGVSCTSAVDCHALVTLAGAYGAISFNGTAWTDPVGIDQNFMAGGIDCTSSTFCMATDIQGYALTYNGTAWSSPTFVRSNLDLGTTGVTCTSSHFCVTFGPDGGNDGLTPFNTTYATYDGSSWSSPATLEQEGGGDLSVSCPTATFCGVGADGLDGLTLTGTTWHRSANVDDAAQNPMVSCVSAAFCVSVGGTSVGADALTFDGTTWSAPSAIDNGFSPTAISCVSVSFCVLVDSTGDVVTGHPGAWSLPTLDINTSYLSDLACTSTSFCFAIGLYGEWTYNGSRWAKVTTTNAPGAPSKVSCVGHVCFVYDSYSADIDVFNGSSWAVLKGAGNDSVVTNAISCASTNFCMAVGGTYGSEAKFYFSGVWSSWETVAPAGSALTSVSCPTTSRCVAATQDGLLYSFVTPRIRTLTTLTVTPRLIAFGHEQKVAVSIVVRSAPVGAKLSGVARVLAGARVLCAVRLTTAGRGACRLSARKLNPGTYRLTAKYLGTATFLASSSAARTLVVRR